MDRRGRRSLQWVVKQQFIAHVGIHPIAKARPGFCLMNNEVAMLMNNEVAMLMNNE